MAFTEYYCQTTADNLNAGSTTADAAVYTSTGGDSDGTSVFTPNDGSTPASTVAAGDWGSVYVTAGATIATFIGRITAVAAGVNGAVTFSTTAKSGTFPAASAGAHTITLKTGGAHKGPNGTISFPFGFTTAAQTNVAGDVPRVNFKNGVNYAVTAAMTQGNAGTLRFQGYTSAAGDGGQAIFDGTIVGASYVILTASGANCDYVDLIFQNNGTTGSAAGFTASGNEIMVRRCVANNVRGHGLNMNGSDGTAVECEAYSCNQSNTASTSGIGLTTDNLKAIRCISHDNSGSNTAGFFVNGHATCISCIADTNGRDGFNYTGSTSAVFINCDVYNNVGDGIALANSTAAHFYIENCNFIKNGGYGIDGTGAGARNGTVINCAFGSGTQANTSGTTTGLKGMVETGSITYASNVTPWVDPANGDFRINLATAQGTGRGTFTQTAASYAGAVAYPDVGACQHLDSPSTVVVSQKTTIFLVDP